MAYGFASALIRRVPIPVRAAIGAAVTIHVECDSEAERVRVIVGDNGEGMAPEKIAGRRVWVGQVSRDIGVRLTDKAWNLTTHKIGPDVDFDRNYLLQDLLLSGFVERYGYVDGVGAASMEAPRTNLTGDPYFTDGQRLVIVLGSKAKAQIETQPLLWQGDSLPAP
jgi:hypothetical protein